MLKNYAGAYETVREHIRQLAANLYGDRFDRNLVDAEVKAVVNGHVIMTRGGYGR